MTLKVYYIENTNALEEALEKIIDSFACWVKRNLIEMNYSEISIKARDEDIKHIEDILAPMM